MSNAPGALKREKTVEKTLQVSPLMDLAKKAWNWIKTDGVSLVKKGIDWVKTEGMKYIKAGWDWIDKNVPELFQFGLDFIKELWNEDNNEESIPMPGSINYAKAIGEVAAIGKEVLNTTTPTEQKQDNIVKHVENLKNIAQKVDSKEKPKEVPKEKQATQPTTKPKVKPDSPLVKSLKEYYNNNSTGPWNIDHTDTKKIIKGNTISKVSFTWENSYPIYNLFGSKLLNYVPDLNAKSSKPDGEIKNKDEYALNSIFKFAKEKNYLLGEIYIPTIMMTSNYVYYHPENSFGFSYSMTDKHKKQTFEGQEQFDKAHLTLFGYKVIQIADYKNYEFNGKEITVKSVSDGSIHKFCIDSTLGNNVEFSIGNKNNLSPMSQEFQKKYPNSLIHIQFSPYSLRKLHSGEMSFRMTFHNLLISKIVEYYIIHSNEEYKKKYHPNQNDGTLIRFAFVFTD